MATEGPIPVPGGTEASAAPELSQSKPEALHEVLATLPSEMLQKLAGPYRWEPVPPGTHHRTMCFWPVCVCIGRERLTTRAPDLYVCV